MSGREIAREILIGAAVCAGAFFAIAALAALAGLALRGAEWLFMYIRSMGVEI